MGMGCPFNSYPLSNDLIWGHLTWQFLPDVRYVKMCNITEYDRYGTYVPIFIFSLAARNEGIIEAAKSNTSIKHKMLNFSLYSLFLVEKITEFSSTSKQKSYFIQDLNPDPHSKKISGSGST